MASEQAPFSTPTRKRLNSADNAPSSKIPHTDVANVLFRRPLDPDVAKFLDDDRYVCMILSKDMAKSFKEFLTKGLAAIEDISNKTITIEEFDKDYSQAKTSNFQDVFKSIKKTLVDNLDANSSQDFSKKLDECDFDKFKKCRSMISKWFVSGEHLSNKLRDNSRTNQYLKVGLDFSPAVTSQNLKDKCSSELTSLRDRLEMELSMSVVDNCIDKCEALKSEILETSHNPQDSYILSKAFRAVLLYHKDLAKDLLRHIPKTKEYVVYSNQYKRRPGQNYHEFRRRPNNNYHRQFDRNDVDDGYDDHGTRFRRPVYHDDHEQVERRQQSRRPQYRREFVDDVDDRPHYRRQSRNFSVTDRYDEDFPAYNNNFTQKKQRYESVNDEVFERKRRQSFRSNKPNFKWV